MGFDYAFIFNKRVDRFGNIFDITPTHRVSGRATLAPRAYVNVAGNVRVGKRNAEPHGARRPSRLSDTALGLSSSCFVINRPHLRRRLGGRYDQQHALGR